MISKSRTRTHRLTPVKLNGGTPVISRLRLLGAGLMACVFAVTLGACSSDPHPDTSAETSAETSGGTSAEALAATAAQNFLDELVAGNHEAALAFTTSSREDFACPSLTEDLQRGTISSPAVGSVTVDGATATVSTEYFVTPFGDVEKSFTLEQVGEDWLVVLPDTYRIAFEFDGPTIATLGINRIVSHSHNLEECQIVVTDGAAETPALPGMYMIDIVDTTGVFTPDRQRSAAIGSDLGPIEMPAIYEPDFDWVSKLASKDLRTMFLECVDSDFASATTCPAGSEGLTFAGDPATLSDELENSQAFALARVWTEDEQTWLFTSETVPIDVIRDGEEVSLDVAYSGQLKTDADGNLEVVLD